MDSPTYYTMTEQQLDEILEQKYGITPAMLLEFINREEEFTAKLYAQFGKAVEDKLTATEKSAMIQPTLDFFVAEGRFERVGQKGWRITDKGALIAAKREYMVVNGTADSDL